MLLASLIAFAPLAAFGADELFAPPSRDEVKARALEWAAAQKLADPAVIEKIGKTWGELAPEATTRQIFDCVIETFRIADVETRRFTDACDLKRANATPPDIAPLVKKHAADEFYVANMKLYFARNLAQRNYFDEALDILKTLEPAQVADPATCLFFRAVCEHQLLQKNEGLATIKRLLEQTQQVPEAYAGVAQLMQHDLSEMEDESLGVISHKMRDSERRLDLGRGGQKVQKVQEEIVTSLDELIKKKEQQQQQQQQSSEGDGSGQNNSNQSNSPANDSKLKGATAPCEIDPKTFKKQGGWGALPPKEEARAKNLINQQFPAHYRQAVEQYFKKLANRKAPNESKP